MFLLFTTLAFCMLCLLSFALENNFFINPPNAGQPLLFVDNELYVIGDNANVQWATEETQYSIWLWQQSLTVGSGVLGETVFTKILGGPEQSAFSWTVTQQSFDLQQSSVFFFALGPTPDINANTTTSHYFNLTEKAESQPETTNQTSGTLTSSTPSTASIPQATGYNASSGTSTPVSTQPQDTGHESKIKEIALGIGLGVGIGILGFLVGTFFVLRFQKRRHVIKASVDTLPQYSGPKLQSSLHSSPKEVSGASPSIDPRVFWTQRKVHLDTRPAELAVERASSYASAG